MNKIFLLIATILIFATSCKNVNSELKDHITNADSIAINYFRGDGRMDTVVTVKIIRDKKIITQLSDLIAANKMSTINKCGYDGSLHFFKNNIVIQDIDFRMNDVNCMQFSFVQDGELAASELSPEAKQLLESVRK